MAPRSLPERTVDAWVSGEICSKFPGALLWAPTQAGWNNWDYGASLGDGKVFVLEDKATTPIERTRKHPRSTHRIDIPRRQLDWYCNEVEPQQGVPVYYVLPKPPWAGAWTGSPVLPDRAVCRMQSGDGPFSAWAWVVRCTALLAFLGTRNTLDTDKLPLAASGCLSLQEFLDRVRICEIGKVVHGSGEGRRAASKVSFETVEPGVAEPTESRGRLERSDTRLVGSALAVFVPAADLPDFPG